jgi:HSP20 family protein
LRYKYIAYKYTRRSSPDASFQSMMESFSTWAVPSSAAWLPPTDVYETPDAIIIFMEVAGVGEEDMAVTLFSDILVVEGNRKQPLLAEMNACHRLGIKYGKFRSEISIPYPVDHNDVTAEYKNGLLKIILRRTD